MSNRKRFLSLTVIALFAVAALIVTLASARTQTPQPPQAPKSTPPALNDREALAKKPAPSGTLSDRLDKDDGYAIALFYSMGIHGNLEVCGCPIHPLGGVARRAGYMNAFRARSPEAAVLQVDAGYIFNDETNLAGNDLRADARLMNDWIVRANEALGMDVVNLGYRDLRYAAGLLAPNTAIDAKIKAATTALVSANVKPIKAGTPTPAPYVIKIVTGKRLPRPVRIAFIGVSDLPADEYKADVEASGFVINDPLAAAKAALAEVRDKADVTVVVGYLKLPTVNKLALQNADLDLIINADERGLVPDPKQLNNTLIVYAAKETKHLGELRFYVDAEGTVDHFTARYVELDEVIPDDPKMAEMTRAARKELDAVQVKVAEEEAAQIAAKGTTDPSPYVLSQTCATCHQAEFEIWQKSRHSHAFAALATKQRSYDTACVGCHSLGFQEPGGFVNIKATPQLADVQCESCHGPGAAHVKAPTAGNYKTPPKNQSCLGCHDRDNSPDFVFEKYWPVIAHGNALAPAKADNPVNKPRTKRPATKAKT